MAENGEERHSLKSIGSMSSIVGLPPNAVKNEAAPSIWSRRMKVFAGVACLAAVGVVAGIVSSTSPETAVTTSEAGSEESASEGGLPFTPEADELLSIEDGFSLVGDGACRANTGDNDETAQSVYCSDSCSMEYCANKCLAIQSEEGRFCTGYEFQLQYGRCELHFGNIGRVESVADTKCYKQRTNPKDGQPPTQLPTPMGVPPQCPEAWDPLGEGICSKSGQPVTANTVTSCYDCSISQCKIRCEDYDGCSGIEYKFNQGKCTLYLGDNAINGVQESRYSARFCYSFDSRECNSREPTPYPTPYVAPTNYPTPYVAPTNYPTPYVAPTNYPTPYVAPTNYPTPYVAPTNYPTPYVAPTNYPTPYVAPTNYPTPYVAPTNYPTYRPATCPVLGNGMCGDANGNIPYADKVCDNSHGDGCSMEECEYLCSQRSTCTAYSYKGNSATCQLHYTPIDSALTSYPGYVCRRCKESPTAPPTLNPTPWPTEGEPTPYPVSPTRYPTNRPPTRYPTNAPPTPYPVPPTRYPTNRPPTRYPTNAPPTPYPVPPTRYPTNRPPTRYPTEAPRPTPYPTPQSRTECEPVGQGMCMGPNGQELFGNRVCGGNGQPGCAYGQCEQRCRSSIGTCTAFYHNEVGGVCDLYNQEVVGSNPSSGAGGSCTTCDVYQGGNPTPRPTTRYPTPYPTPRQTPAPTWRPTPRPTENVECETVGSGVCVGNENQSLNQNRVCGYNGQSSCSQGECEARCRSQVGSCTGYHFENGRCALYNQRIYGSNPQSGGGVCVACDSYDGEVPTPRPTTPYPTPYPTNRPPTRYPTNAPPTPYPVPPTRYPTNRPPTRYPTNRPPTPQPTDRPSSGPTNPSQCPSFNILDGVCRTANGGLGTSYNPNCDNCSVDKCKHLCLSDSDCVAFEYKDNYCEVHSETIAYADSSIHGAKCGICQGAWPSPTPAYRPTWRPTPPPTDRPTNGPTDRPTNGPTRVSGGGFCSNFNVVSGACRESNGGQGDYYKPSCSSCNLDKCRGYCLNDSQCVAFEYGPGGCEVHKKTMAYGDSSVKNTSCGICSGSSPGHSPTPWPSSPPQKSCNKVGHGHCLGQYGKTISSNTVCDSGNKCSISDCKARCSSTSNCSGFYYRESEGKCALYHDSVHSVSPFYGKVCYACH